MKEAILHHFADNWLPFFAGYLGELKAAGKQHRARCPFHDDHNPSLDVESTKGLWHCKVCNVGGDSFQLVQKMTGLDFTTVLKDIGAKFGIKGYGSSKPEQFFSAPVRHLVKRYIYQDPNGAPLFCKNRFEPKGFSLCRPDGHGGYISGMGTTKPELYRLPAVLRANEVWIVEGGKDADALAELGITATCNFDGAGKWSNAYSSHLKGKDVILVPDCDEPGQAHMQKVAEALHGVARSIRMLKLPNPAARKGYDVSDLLEDHDAHENPVELLRHLVTEAKVWQPGQEIGPVVAPEENTLAQMLLDFQVFNAIEFPPRRTFLGPWLQEQSIGMIYGWRGGGKTYFGLGVLDAVTKGKGFGPWTPGDLAVPALLLDAEMPSTLLQLRSREMKIGEGTKARAMVLSMDYAVAHGLPMGNLLDEKWRDHMTGLLISTGIKLFLLDNVSSLSPYGDENSKEPWAPVNQWLLYLRFRGRPVSETMTQIREELRYRS